MTQQKTSDSVALRRHRQLIEGLLRPAAYAHPVHGLRLIETHISSLVLTGDWVYKLKKPLDLGFLDFRRRSQRRHFCAEELRLNRRMAAEIYADVVSVGGAPAAPRIGAAGPALDYAVRMRQFDPNRTLDRLATAGTLSAPALDRFIDALVEWHAGFPVAPAGSHYGSGAAVLAPMLENVRRIRIHQPQPASAAQLDRLECWTREQHGLRLPAIEARRHAGRVRECHGDLHLGNLVQIGDRILAFDALEFAPELRWIDVASELAFLAMDLIDRSAPALAHRCINRYLETSGDWSAATLLDWYQCYRALVRAKVATISHSQAKTGAARATAARQYLDYLDLASRLATREPARLVLMQGLSGSGKSVLAGELVETHGFLRLRADVERKRLAGLAATANSHASGLDLYSTPHTVRTYARLLELSEALLGAGCQVVVDATFLRRAQRLPFLHLARRLGQPCTILALQGSAELLRARIVARRVSGGDPSEADLAVLDKQLQAVEPFSETERTLAHVIHVAADDTVRIDPASWPTSI